MNPERPYNVSFGFPIPTSFGIAYFNYERSQHPVTDEKIVSFGITIDFGGSPHYFGIKKSIDDKVNGKE